MIDTIGQFFLSDRRNLQAVGDEFGGGSLIVGASGDELDFRGPVTGEIDVEREARRRIESPQLALISERARARLAQALRRRHRSFAQKAGARILIAYKSRVARQRSGGEESHLAASCSRRAQQAIAREYRVESANKESLDMHAGEIEIARIGARFMGRDLGEAGQAQAPGAAGLVLKTQAPGDDGAALVGSRLEICADAADFRDVDHFVSPALLEAVSPGPPGRLVADRPRWRSLLAKVEKDAARLQGIERTARQIDGGAATFFAGHEGGAATIAHCVKADRAVAQRNARRKIAKHRRRAR